MEVAVQPAESGLEALASLEERIRRATDMVASLRAERDAAISERDLAKQAAGPAIEEARQLRSEVDALRKERTEVRKRIEKLLGQLDSI